MANPVEGVPVAFEVHGLNRKKVVVPVSGVTGASSDASDSVSVGGDGKGGSVTFGSAGARTLTFKDDKGHSVDFPVTVDADVAVDSLEVVLS